MESARSYEELPEPVQAIVSPIEYRSLVQELVAPYAKQDWELLMPVVLPKFRRMLFDKFADILGILCLTESPESLLMWAHYADKHQGFVVEFDPESAFFKQQISPEDDFRHLRNVIYRDERPTVVLTEVEDFSPFLTKSTDWSYEAEWRMIMPLSSASRIIGEGPTAVHLFEFPRSMVRRVIFGCRMSESIKMEIRQILAERPEYVDVSCAEARIDETQYRVLLADAGAQHQRYTEPTG